MSYLGGRSDGSQEWVRRWRGRFTVCKCQTINLIMTIKLVVFLKWTIKIEQFDIEISEILKNSLIGS